MQKDDKLRQVMQGLIQGNPSQQDYELKGGRSYYKGRLVVPKDSPRIPLILEEFHNTVLGGPFRFFQNLQTYLRVIMVGGYEEIHPTVYSSL